MGKAAVAKKKKGPSVHSRASRRATSPGIDVDRSLKELRPPSSTTAINSLPSALAVRRGAGVCKRTSKPTRKTVLSSRARRRRTRDAEIALAVAERTAAKAEGGKVRAKAVQERGRTWDEVNQQVQAGDAAQTDRAARNGFAVLRGRDGEKDEDDGSDDDDSLEGGGGEDVGGDRDMAEGSGRVVAEVGVAAAVTGNQPRAPPLADDDVEIL